MDLRKLMIGGFGLAGFLVLSVQFARLVGAAPEREVQAACRGLQSAPSNQTYTLAEGAAAPMALDFEAVDYKGNKVKLSDYRGKVVLVNFWASWCNVCRTEKSGLEALQKRYRNDLVVLALASDTDWDAVRKALPQGTPLQVLLDPPASPDENLGKIAKNYGITAVPETFVIDREGRLRYYLINRRDWNSDIANTCLRAML